MIRPIDFILWKIDLEIKRLMIEYDSLRFAYDAEEAKKLNESISRLREKYEFYESMR